MSVVNIALSFLCLAVLCLALARMIHRNEQRNIDLRARGKDKRDGENFI